MGTVLLVWGGKVVTLIQTVYIYKYIYIYIYFFFIYKSLYIHTGDTVAVKLIECMPK